MTLLLPDEASYRSHYVSAFARAPLNFHTSVGSAPIYFAAGRFEHAFFESSNRDGVKDQFSLVRAQRMDEISTALASATAERRAGWDSQKRSHDHTHCVSVALNDFVVIVRLGLTKAGYLRGNFVTCFVADNSIGKIRSAPVWSEARCVQLLTQRKGR